MPITKKSAVSQSTVKTTGRTAAGKSAAKNTGVGKSTAAKTTNREAAAASKTVDPETAVSTAPTYGWVEVARRAKPPTDGELALYAVQVAPDLLRIEGARVASDRILTDALRWSGTLLDFTANAPADLVREVRGFSLGLLRVFVAESHRLYEMNQRFQTAQSARKAGARVDQAAATSTRKLAQSYRRQLVAVLKSAAQQDGTTLRRVAEAQGALEQSAALHALVALARELMADKASAAGQRLILGGVDAAYLGTITTLATQAADSGTRITGPKKSTPVSQGELDVQDGLCLALMDQLLLLFEAAHAINPKIPALLPIATRRYFVSHKSPAKTLPAPPAAGATATAK